MLMKSMAMVLGVLAVAILPLGSGDDAPDPGQMLVGTPYNGQILVPSNQLLNRILWYSAKGWITPYPSIPHGPDCPKED